MSYRPYRSQGINPIWVIIIVNVIVFLAEIFNQSIIYSRFGLVPATIGQEPWTVFTYMFVHADYLHIFFNMLTLYFFGMFALQLVGELAFLGTYFIGGIVGGLMYLALASLTGNEISIVVGASGAIYAIGGLLMVMRPNIRVLFFFFIPTPLWIAILIGFAMAAIPQVGSGIAWQAHLGGLLFGAAVGYYFRRREIRRF
jgi:membrane associated rhomboid family serine protease